MRVSISMLFLDVSGLLTVMLLRWPINHLSDQYWNTAILLWHSSISYVVEFITTSHWSQEVVSSRPTLSETELRINNYSPILLFRNDSDRTGLRLKRSDMRGMSTCCHLANRLALPMKSEGDIALYLSLRKSKFIK